MEAFRSSINIGLDQINKFITMIYARFEVESKTMSFVDAGHTPILWYSNNEERWTELKGMNHPIGIPSEKDFVQKMVKFDSGDAFLFYSDGILEGKSPDKVAFGDNKMIESLKNNQKKSANDLLKKLIDDYQDFVKTETYFDDLTIVVVKIL
jgi:sigma-B regulation protein RsbU (phosphoserine phosphatase)